ncbi:MAG: hypothetical protein MZU97_01075 [Bacillus subtilis]|nr:hypothetical protein [Bacillus subtilis]
MIGCDFFKQRDHNDDDGVFDHDHLNDDYDDFNNHEYNHVIHPTDHGLYHRVGT